MEESRIGITSTIAGSQKALERELLGRRLETAKQAERKKIWASLYNDLLEKTKCTCASNENSIVAKDASNQEVGHLKYQILRDREKVIFVIRDINVIQKGIGIGTLLHLYALLNNPNVNMITAELGYDNVDIYRLARKQGLAHLEALTRTPAYGCFTACGFTELDAMRSPVETRKTSLPRLTMRLPQQKDI